ncbi:MAG: response regulator [Halobacteriaceae archaeon]
MSERGQPRPADILLVEDNPGDVKLTRKAFETAKLANDLHVVNDGETAMEFLRQEGEYADAPRPDIVLLDLKLPKMTGEEVLEAVKADPDLRRLPVVVLTSSSAEEDVVKTYDKHANAYLTKPVSFDGFIDVVQRIEGFWFSLVRFPPN